MAGDERSQADEEKRDELEEQIQDLDVPADEAKDVTGGMLRRTRRAEQDIRAR